MSAFTDAQTRDYYESYSDVYALIWSQQMHTGYFDRPKNLETACADMNHYLAAVAEITAGSSVLNVGCGRGGTDRFLARQFDASVTGIDISQRQLEEASREAKQAGLDKAIRYEYGLMTALPAADASFDYVWVQEALFHCHDKNQAVREFHRVLKPGGRAIIEDTVLLHPAAKAEVMAAFGERVFINSLSTSAEYEEAFLAAGFRLVTKNDLTDHLASTYRAIADYIAANIQELKQKIDQKYWPTLENDGGRERTLKLVEEDKLGCVCLVFEKS
ncbi:MAG: Demethylrebeccamycin-D-glucose O-methyltransferase [Candidatus Magasanikbacteria bacterium GW2011_GWA2_56_11]|uniref:Demethylrebeccamycin-D-glucose O-methyltransferase n=1 Tax=Candidatus Magasanikbacteria bacterium GW2011_GWA2_56_11 TaxID=1619044 RepID=A0A0G2AN73_9BACT|nr:MAG: Demethylrebeccamycin-D-glucose O-methyltransferase [Candidatus Magasanikbacteria bacterium GW2011_GWA2_56_11]